MNKFQKQQIKALMLDEKWEGLMTFFQETIDKYQNENVIGQTQFETLKMVLMKEGKIIGLKDFFDQLEKYGFE